MFGPLCGVGVGVDVGVGAGGCFGLGSLVPQHFLAIVSTARFVFFSPHPP